MRRNASVLVSQAPRTSQVFGRCDAGNRVGPQYLCAQNKGTYTASIFAGLSRETLQFLRDRCESCAIVGGDKVPADVTWIEGDILSVDTAALTGEPIPRKYPSEDYGKGILAGCTVVAGEAYCYVDKTGGNTELGASQEEILKDKAGGRTISVFEANVMAMVKYIIAGSGAVLPLYPPSLPPTNVPCNLRRPFAF